MNAIFSSALVALALCFLPSSQKAADNPDIVAIREAYQHINSLRCTVEKFKLQDMACVEEGELAYYQYNKETVKIVEKGIANDGSLNVEYYYKNGRLIFALETVVGGPAIGPATKTEFRYYVKNDKAIRQMQGDKIVTPDSKFTELLKVANQLPKAKASKHFEDALCN